MGFGRKRGLLKMKRRKAQAKHKKRIKKRIIEAKKRP